MNESEPRIPKEMAPEVFALASKLYAQHEQSYSISELVEAGAEAKIPPEFIQQAVQQIQLELAQIREQQEKIEVDRSDFRRAAAIAVGVAVALWGVMASGVQIPAFGCHSITSEQSAQSK